MIFHDLVSAIRDGIAQDPSFSHELFTGYEYLSKDSEENCHRKVQNLIWSAANSLPGVSAPCQEKQVGTFPKWRPDARLFDQSGDLIGIVEFESLNSSDTRVISKDLYGYSRWVAQEELGDSVPLLVITTLFDGPASWYRMQHCGSAPWKGAKCGAYNIDHGVNQSESRKSPFKYWYAFFRRWLEHHIKGRPIHFANFSGNQLTLLESWPVPPLEYSPTLNDGADWSGLCAATPEVVSNRISSKRKLWNERDSAQFSTILREFWDSEQGAWKENCWDKGYDDIFQRNCDRVRDREEACRQIELIQWWNLYGIP